MDFNRFINKFFFLIFAISGLIMAVYTFILRTNKSTWDSFNPKWKLEPFVYACWIHFPSGSIMLFTGVLQFVDYLRIHYRKVHIWSGRLYVLSGVLQSLSAWVIIPASKGGLESIIAFSFLNIVYTITLVMAMYYILKKNRNMRKHKHYMTVNVATGYNPVFLRIFEYLYKFHFKYETNIYLAAAITTIGVEIGLGIFVIFKQEIDAGNFFWQKLDIFAQKSIEKQKMMKENQELKNVKLDFSQSTLNDQIPSARANELADSKNNYNDNENKA